MPQATRKKIAVLTSGGDCAGLNAAIRAVVLKAATMGWEVIGIRSGSHGLAQSPADAIVLTPENVDTVMMRQGGTILGTANKGDPFTYPMADGTTKDVSHEMIANFHALGCEALIGIGGDGSLAILSKIVKQGKIPFIGIPKTIDNDLALTETSIGFHTAVDVATEALDRLQPTAASHNRIMVLEVMGRDAGYIALTSGIAGGADVILIPEIPYDIQKVAAHLKKSMAVGKNFALVVVSEAVKTVDGQKVTQSYFGGQNRFGGIGHYIAGEISRLCNAETRVTVLGHVQRGGQPSAEDRLLAAAFGVHAVELIAEGKTGRMVAWQGGKVVDVDVDEAAAAGAQSVEADGMLVTTARGLGICLG